ncbi:DUF305 domain-containing protein [Deinococcus sp. YIM 134068]|uniref:DUF305 domain-containing protein n=1 Tax=Deinococcus lichenicola TaxID=3118910 RepID=UPI002F93DE69
MSKPRRAHTPPLLPALLMALLVALLALTAFVLTRPAPPLPGPASAEVRFTQDMTRHHEQAVTMARLIRPRSTRRTVRSLALDIELSQGEQLRQMRGWLTLWGQGPGAPPTPEHARHMGMASPAELVSLSTLPPREAERAFLRLMIRHHRGALAMVRGVLRPEGVRPGVRPEVLRLARQIEASQRGEIITLTGLLSRLGGPDSSDAAPSSGQHHH